MVLTAGILMVSGCGRDKEPVPPPEDNTSVNVAAADALVTSIKAENMLSRPEVNRADDRPVPSEPVNGPAAQEEPFRADSRNIRTERRQISYRYVSPTQMISDDQKSLLSELSKRPAAEGPSRQKQAAEMRLSDMVALSYVRKTDMLSPDSWLTGLKGDVGGLADSGPGFLADETIFLNDSVMIATPKMEREADPEDVEQAMFFVREAEAFMDQGRLNEAEEFFAKAFNLFPDTTYVNKRLGQICLSRGEYNRAIGYLLAALDPEENVAESLNELGIAYLYAGKSSEALNQFQAAVKADPDYTEPIYNSGLALRQLGRIDEAREMIQAFLNRQPGDARGQRELAMLFLAESNREEAMDMLRAAIEADRSWGMPYLDAAVLYAESTNNLESIDMLDKALDRSPAIPVFRIYSQDTFDDVRLMPEVAGFERKLTNRMRENM